MLLCAVTDDTLHIQTQVVVDIYHVNNNCLLHMLCVLAKCYA